MNTAQSFQLIIDIAFTAGTLGLTTGVMLLFFGRRGK